MPTRHVRPDSDELLQEIADCLWKARKVLVVTGAGISTNSGIPDFRSRNGLYSLIQAQFDAVASGKSQETVKEEESAPVTPAEEGQERPSKRRRRSQKADGKEDRKQATRTTTDVSDNNSSSSSNNDRNQMDNGTGGNAETIHVAEEEGATIVCADDDLSAEQDTIVVELPSLKPERQPRTPQRLADSITCGSDLILAQLPPSSSPLSSPPPILFDPQEEEEQFRSGSTTSGRSSASSAASLSGSESESESEREDDETPDSSQPTLSQASSKGGLPVMKGRDLFDASIWSDPVKTAVFYTFATTLRQKVRDVQPTTSHQFISHLRDTGKLVRCYTQNIDEIEEKVGLTTSLGLGPGRRGRFSRTLSRASSGLSAIKDKESQSQESEAGSQDTTDGKDTNDSKDAKDAKDKETKGKKTANKDPGNRGVECVFLHGSLHLLRCFRCGQTSPWDEDGREDETLSGRQPSCPRCEGATAAREGRGKRALAVGKLRPDIVLYGEEHPNAHLISPLVQHDISLAPDLLLILGTSLKVHGLKVLVREFSKAVHSKGGKVVFVNFTKPPESVWSDIIDYWVEWDCDAWVDDLKDNKKPIMWMPPGTVLEEPKKKRKSMSLGGTKGKRKSSEAATSGEADKVVQAETPKRAEKRANHEDAGADEEQEEERRTPRTKNMKSRADEEREGCEPNNEEKGKDEEIIEIQQEVAPRRKTKRPSAVRDDTTNAAFVLWKIMGELARISGRPADGLARHKITRAHVRRPRHSAPARMCLAVEAETAMEPRRKPEPESDMPERKSKMEPEMELEMKSEMEPILQPKTEPLEEEPTKQETDYSILSAVKAHPRRRRSTKFFEEVLETKPKTKPRSKSMLLASETKKVLEDNDDNDDDDDDRNNSSGIVWPGNDKRLPSIHELFPELPLQRHSQAFFLQDPLSGHYGIPPSFLKEWSSCDQLRSEACEASERLHRS